MKISEITPLGLVLEFLSLYGLKNDTTEVVCARSIPFLMGRHGQERLCFCERHFYALQDDVFMMPGAWSGLRRASGPLAITAEELEHLFAQLLFHFSAENILRAACSEMYPVCQVNTEETGKQVVFNVLWYTEDKTIRKGQRQYGLLYWKWGSGSLSPSGRWITNYMTLVPHCFEALPILDAFCARPVTSRKNFICTIAITKKKNCNGLFKIKDAGRKPGRKRAWESHLWLLITFTRGRKKNVETFQVW